jgi:alkylation response protein AidB-like acyl-CoA dehydrogenase
MKLTNHAAELRGQLFLADKINDRVLSIIHQEKWLQIWVPKNYNGLNNTLTQGLNILQELARIDGSLGWMVTLCSGANYFSRNLPQETARHIFNQPDICFGGSGFLGGTAEKKGEQYIINGLWHYATGAPHLTHFTLNAQLVENGKRLINEQGEPLFLSFILEANQVEILNNWKTMGMVPTASHSFAVKNQVIPASYSFAYNTFYTEDILDRVPFQVFADLTLAVNYLGMAQHFVEASEPIVSDKMQDTLLKFIEEQTAEVHRYAKKVEQQLCEHHVLEADLIQKIHDCGVTIVDTLITYMMRLYPLIGIRAATAHEEVNQVFRDFFTATQHKNFRRNTVPSSLLETAANQ